MRIPMLSIRPSSTSAIPASAVSARPSRGALYMALPPASFQMADGEPPAPGTPAAGSGTSPEGVRLPSSPAELQELITRAVAIEREAFQRQLTSLQRQSGMPDKDREELERLRRDHVDRERKAAEERGQYDRALASVHEEHKAVLTKAQQEQEALLTELRQVRCHDALLAEASKADAINPAQVSRLLTDHVKLDDRRRVVVLDENGEPWLKGGKNISIADLMEKFASDNPHLFKPKPGTSAGAQGGSSTSDTSVEGLDAEIAKAQEAYDKAHKEAQEGGDVGSISRARNARKVLSDLQAKKKAAARG